MNVLTNALIIIATFCVMELVAWFLHKYILHTFLWFVHDTHHLPRKGLWEKNDLIAFVFGIPSWLFMMFGIMAGCDWRLYVGIGILLYGVCYVLIHDGLVHQRFRIFSSSPRNWYLLGLKLGHEAHHQHDGKSDYRKENDVVWGMLWVPHRYFRQAAEVLSSRPQKAGDLG
ncbi:MAG: sterol desaturase family protein [Flavobacteriales bacterium]|nr:sterol desaturase family protein [Flavobacteriales bacterium]